MIKIAKIVMEKLRRVNRKVGKVDVVVSPRNQLLIEARKVKRSQKLLRAIINLKKKLLKRNSRRRRLLKKR